MTLPLPANWTTGSSFTAAAEDNVESVLNSLANGSIVIPRRVNTSAASTLTLANTYNVYEYTGSSTATWTLPSVSGNTGTTFWLYNRGSGNVTVTRAGTDQIQSGASLVNTVTLATSGSMRLVCDGTYWLVMSSYSSQTTGTSNPVYDNSALASGARLTAKTSGTAITWTQNVGSGGPYGIVAIFGDSGSNYTFPAATAAVTFGGVTLTNLGYSFADNASNKGWVWLFGGASIPSGSQTVTATITQSGKSFYGNLASFTYSNVGFAAKPQFGNGIEQTPYQNHTAIYGSLGRASAAPGVVFNALYGSGTGNLVACSANIRQTMGAGSFGILVGSDSGTVNGDPVGVCMDYLAGASNWAVALMELLAVAPTGVYNDGVGVGSGGASHNLSWSQTAKAGDTVLMFVEWYGGSGTNITGATYGGSAMTLRATAYNNNDTSGGSGQLQLYSISSVTAGTQTVALTGGNPEALAAESVAYSNVHAIGTPVSTNGTGTTLSQSATCSANQIIVQAFGIRSYLPNSAVLGGANWYIAEDSPNACTLTINDSIASTTFSTTKASTTAAPWSSMTVVLS